MFMNKSLISVALASVWLAGCAPSQQDEGTAQVQMSARALDGYVMKGTVYADFNENGKMDFFESPDKALTDTNGYAGYNSKTSKDYCASTVEKDLAKCLKVSSGLDEVILRVAGGYNKSTGVEFVGTLGAKVAVGGSVSQANIISPITSVMVGMDSTEAATFATTQSRTLAELKSDYLDLTNGQTEATRRALLATGMQLHKTADVLFATLNGAAGFNGAFGAESGLVTDATPYAYEAIAANLGTNTVSTALNNTTVAGAIVNDLVTKMNSKVTELGAGTTVTTITAAATVKDKVTALALLADNVFSTTLIADDAVTTTVNEMERDILGRARAIEVVTTLLRTHEATDLAVTQAIGAAADPVYIANISVPAFSMKTVVDLFEATSYTGPTDVDFSARTTLDLASIGTLSSGTDVINLNFDEAAGTFTLDPTNLDLGGDINLVDANGNPIQLAGTFEPVDEYTTVMTVEIAPGITQDYVVTSGPSGGYLIDINGELVPWSP